MEVLTTTEQLQSLTTDWETLWRNTPSATPFQSPHWLLPWWTHFGSGDLFTIAVRDGSGLRAVAPLYILRDDDTDESLGLLLGTGISDYLDILSADGLTEAIAGTLAGADCQLWDLQQLRPESPLMNMSPPAGFTETIEDHDVCPVASLEGAGEELEGLLSAHARKKLRYYRRTAEREGRVSFQSASEPSLDTMLDDLFTLHRARWQRRGLNGVLDDEVVQSFHRDVARRMLAAGALRLYVMRIEARVVAVFYGFADAHTVYYYLGGYDPEFEHLSPGSLIVAHAVEEAVRGGAAWFDFLRGAEEYKHGWGGRDRQNRRKQWVRGSTFA